MHAIQACQRSSGKVAPRLAGGVGGATARPLVPPKKPEKRVASDGRPTASASVAPARYGPRRRAAAAPASAPAAAATSEAASSTGASGHDTVSWIFTVA